MISIKNLHTKKKTTTNILYMHVMLSTLYLKNNMFYSYYIFIQ